MRTAFAAMEARYNSLERIALAANGSAVLAIHLIAYYPSLLNNQHSPSDDPETPPNIAPCAEW